MDVLSLATHEVAPTRVGEMKPIVRLPVKYELGLSTQSKYKDSKSAVGRNTIHIVVKIEKAEKETLKSSYASQLNCSSEELRKLHEAFKIKELHTCQLQQETGELKQQLKDNQLASSEKEKEIFLLQQQISEIQDDKFNLHNSLEKSEEVVKELKLVKSELAEELATLKLKSADVSEEFRNKLSTLECSLENETIRKKELESMLNEKEKEIEELKEKYDSVTEKLNESSHQCDDMQKLMEELASRKLYLEESILKQQEALQELQLANDELTVKGLLLEDAQKRIMQQEEELNDLKKEHAIKLTSLDDNLKEKQGEIDKLQFSNAAIEEELKLNLSKIEDLEKQIKTLNKRLKIKTKVNIQSKDKLQATLETTVKENETLMAKIVSLQEELGKTRSEWETEKENMKNSHKLEMKEILDLLDKTEENYRSTTQTKEAEIQELKSEITKLSDDLKTEHKKLEKTENDWEKEKSSTKELHSSQMKDVFDILRKAEESYRKTILVKEGEAEELRNEIANYSSHARIEENRETEIKRLRYEKDNLQDVMENTKKINEAEIKRLRYEKDNLQDMIENMKKINETEIKRLRYEKDNLQDVMESTKKINEAEIKRLRYEKDNLQDVMENMKKINETEILKLQSENDKLHIELETLQESKEIAVRLHDESRHLQVELENLKKEYEKITARSQRELKEETGKSSFDTLRDDTISANIMRGMVKKSPLATAEIQPKPRQEYKSYSRSSSCIPHPVKNSMKRSLMPITEVKPLQEENLSLDPKPSKQRKFFKSSRAIKRQIKDTGLLWFDLEEEEEE